MAQKDGSLSDLIEQRIIADDNLASRLFLQMLRGLDYLACSDIIHRDIKPDNILYTHIADGTYIVQIADFGLAKYAYNAATRCGTPIFMAPEVLFRPGRQQSTKMDVWSLFVTIAYAKNADHYHEKYPHLHTDNDIYEAAMDAAKDPKMAKMKEMAIEDPVKRASAAQMLLRLCNGEGMTTPRERVNDPDQHMRGTSEDLDQPM